MKRWIFIILCLLLVSCVNEHVEYSKDYNSDYQNTEKVVVEDEDVYFENYGWYVPKIGDTFYIQLNGYLNLNYDVDVYVVDLFETSEKDIDFRLMKAVQKGNMVAFNELVDRYKDRLLNVIGRMVNSSEEAEDIVQETFIRVYQHRQSFNFQHCLSTWIYTIGLNLGRNELRKRKKFKHYDINEMQGNESAFAVEMKLPTR